MRTKLRVKSLAQALVSACSVRGMCHYLLTTLAWQLTSSKAYTVCNTEFPSGFFFSFFFLILLVVLMLVGGGGWDSRDRVPCTPIIHKVPTLHPARVLVGM